MLISTEGRAQHFTEVTTDLGIIGTYGYANNNFGGGVSFCDFNGDGWDDLTFTSGEEDEGVFFFLNTGGSGFVKVSLIEFTDVAKEAVWVDYDNDGDKDLFVTSYFGQSRLFQNIGLPNFTDVTFSAFTTMPIGPTTGQLWFDYDLDGYLDLLIMNYSVQSGGNNRLYHNNGNGTFSQITDQPIIADGNKLTFDACELDYNSDGWPDIYVINDKFVHANTMFQNSATVFSDVSQQTNTDVILDAMNAGGGDYDDDGDFDLYITNSDDGNLLLRNEGDGTFSDQSLAAGVGGFDFGWAANFFDYDNDQDQDLYVSTQDIGFNQDVNHFFVNDGNGQFTEPLMNSGGLGGNDYGASFGNAMGDFNNDGLLDIAVNQSFIDNFKVWRNDESNSSHWLKVDLTGTVSNLDAIGARVEVEVAGKTMTRFLHGSVGYLSQHADYLHFGLGDATLINRLTVYWPSGLVDQLTNLSTIDQKIFITEGQSPLPLTLLDFSLNTSRNSVQLDWQTINEDNTAYFQIERSADGRDFQALDRVQAAGFSESELAYTYTDHIPVYGDNFYRLKMVDLDGSYHYSPVLKAEILSIDGTNPMIQCQLLTNPVQEDELALGVELVNGGELSLTLHDQSGRPLANWGFNLTAGSHRLDLPLTALPVSAYWLRWSFQGQLGVLRIIKQ